MEIDNLKKIDEKIIYHTFDNGLKLIFHQTNEQEEMAFYVTKYGSLNANYEFEGKKYRDPKGIAHFLEHLKFNTPEGDTFHKFTNLGGAANAYTSFEQTTYLFTTTVNFLKNLKVLVEMVQCNYFTDKDVNKEVGIITQEIEMYNDMNEWVAFRETLNNITFNSEYQEDIAGSITSIREITAEHLRRIFSHFYVPQNQFLVISSKEDPQKVITFLETINTLEKGSSLPLPLFDSEPSNVKKSKKIIVKNKTKPYISYAIKLENDFNIEHLELKNLLALVLEIKFSKTSIFFEKNIKNSLIEDDFNYEIIYDKYLKTVIFTFYSDYHSVVIDNIKNEFKKQINEKEYLRAKNYFIAKDIRLFNDNREVCQELISLGLYDIMISKYQKINENITYNNLKLVEAHLSNFSESYVLVK